MIFFIGSRNNDWISFTWPSYAPINKPFVTEKWPTSFRPLFKNRMGVHNFQKTTRKIAKDERNSTFRLVLIQYVKSSGKNITPDHYVLFIDIKHFALKQIYSANPRCLVLILRMFKVA